MATAFKRLTPLFNRILVKKLEVSTKTSSGIILSEASDKTSVGVVIEVLYKFFYYTIISTPDRTWLI